MPWAVAGAVIGAGSAYYQGKQADKAAKGAAQRSERAQQEAMRRADEAMETTEEQLAPFMGQELAASEQLMAQMGMAAPSGGWGAGMATGGGRNAASAAQEQFVRDAFADFMAITTRAGYNEKSGKAQAESARTLERVLQRYKQQGKLPEDFEVPSYQDLFDMGMELEAQGFDWGNYARDPKNPKHKYRHGKDWSDDMILGHLDRLGGAEALSPSAVAAAGGEGAPGEPGQMAGGPQAKTAEDILAIAGIEGLDPELRDQYMAEVMRSAEDDPALAEYLGLTPESARVGAEYQELPAYMRAMEQGREQVLQSGAGAGHLYSGRRGEEVTRMAHDVEGRYYDRAQREHEGMLGRRFGQRGAEIGLMGAEVGAGRARQSDAYNNYMATLRQISAPTTTSNVAAMRQGTAAGTGANILSTARDVNASQMAGTAAGNAAIADVAGGIMEMGSAFIK